jgi:predicted alpha/beta-hydrolase family hydrolase
MSDQRAWTAVAIGASAKFGVAAVQEGVAGYEIDAPKGLTDTWAAAHALASRANEAAGLSPNDAWRIIESSIAASRAAGLRWGPR